MTVKSLERKDLNKSLMSIEPMSNCQKFGEKRLDGTFTIDSEQTAK